MVNRLAVVAELKEFGEDAHTITWTGLLNGDIGVGPVSGGPNVMMGGSTVRSIQVEGTLGASGNVQVQGSNDGTNYRVLEDITGTALDIAALSIKQIATNTKFLRVEVTNGDGSTDLTVTVFVRRPMGS